MRVFSPVLTVVLWCLSSSGFSWQIQSAHGANVLASGGDHRIILDVVVTDESGNSVAGSQPEDFTILDNKQAQPIISFRAIDETSKAAHGETQAVFVIDAVNTSWEELAFKRHELEKFLRQNSTALPVPASIVLLADERTLIQPLPTRDTDTLVKVLKNNYSGVRFHAPGVYPGLDRARTSIRTLNQLADYEKTKPGRKLVIWLSSGWPLLSGQNVELTAKDQQSIFSEVIRLSTSLREARITLYCIESGGAHYYRNFVKGVVSTSRAQAGNLGLQVLAVQSGGRVLMMHDIPGAIARCLADARAFYTLSFNSAAAGNPNEYHELEVKVGTSGLSARTRTGYYAQP